jgi:hypothetical protein
VTTGTSAPPCCAGQQCSRHGELCERDGWKDLCAITHTLMWGALCTQQDLHAGICTSLHLDTLQLIQSAHQQAQLSFLSCSTRKPFHTHNLQPYLSQMAPVPMTDPTTKGLSAGHPAHSKAAEAGSRLSGTPKDRHETVRHGQKRSNKHALTLPKEWSVRCDTWVTIVTGGMWCQT